MTNRQTKNVVEVLLSVLGLTAVGLSLGLHKLLWRLWIVVSTLWVVALLLLGSSEGARTGDGNLLIEVPGYWLLIIVPPLLLLVIGMLVAWIVDGISDD